MPSSIDSGYRRRHDKVLRELANVLEVERRRKRPPDQKQRQIQFVRQGKAIADKRATRQKAVLDRGHDWELRVDLDSKLVFPNIVETTLRPDAVLVSQQSNTFVAIQLIVPWEENCEEAHERKNLKYADLMAYCKDKVWSVRLFPVEVGCRGAHTTRDVRKNTQDNNKKQQNGHPAGYGTAETICARIGIRRAVDWPPLLTRQLEDIMV